MSSPDGNFTEVLKISGVDIRLKIIILLLQPHLFGANELIDIVNCNDTLNGQENFRMDLSN